MALESPRTVLIIDDEAEVRADLEGKLRALGCRVISCPNAKDGLAYLASNALPTLVLLDLVMPGQDGVWFRTQQLRDPRLASLAIVLMVVSARLSATYEMIGLPIQAKPIPLNALEAELRRAEEESGKPARVPQARTGGKGER